MSENIKLDYKSIATSLWKYYGERMSVWESGFIDDLVMRWEGEYTDRQKEIILRLNRKYRVKR